MSQYGAPDQSRSPAPGGMGYGQASQQSQYGAPQDPYAQQSQGQYGQEQGGRPEQQNETFAPQSQEGEQNQQGQANQMSQGQQAQQGQGQGQGSDWNKRPDAGALQAAEKPGPAASHPHSRFHQDPHHHAAMSAFHKIASAIYRSSISLTNC